MRCRVHPLVREYDLASVALDVRERLRYRHAMSVNLNDEESAALREFALAARQRLGSRLVELRLFGSKARGDAAPDSDIDVAVLVDHPDVADRETLIDLATDVNVVRGVYVSPRLIPLDVLHHPVWRLTGFLRAVEQEGVPVP